MRSSTRTPRASSSTRAWEGESSLSKTARSHSSFSMSSLSSSTLPPPRKLWGSGLSLVCKSVQTGSAPAVSVRAQSSSMLTSSLRSRGSMLAAASPARAARSFLTVVSLMVVFLFCDYLTTTFSAPSISVSSPTSAGWMTHRAAARFLVSAK